MAEAHQPFAAFECAVDPRLDALAGADGIEHLQHRLRRTAVKRSGQRAISRRNRREQVGLRRGYDPRRKCRRVHPVIAHCHEISIERLNLARIGFAAEHHRQRIGGVAGGWIGRDGIVAP